MKGEQAYVILKKKIGDTSGGGGTPSEGTYLRIKVMDQGEYEALPFKDPNTLYMIRG